MALSPGDPKEEGFDASVGAKTGSKQVLGGVVMLAGSLLMIFLVVFFLQTFGSVRVPVGAIIVLIVGGAIGVLDGLRRIVLAYRAKGVFAAAVVGVLLVGIGVWMLEESSYKEAVGNLRFYDYLAQLKAKDYVTGHSWSPKVAELDDVTWKMVSDSKMNPEFIQMYTRLFPTKGRHTADLNEIKGNVLRDMRKEPSIDGCRWYIKAFGNFYSTTSRNDSADFVEVRGLLLKAAEKRGTLNILTPPPAVFAELLNLEGPITMTQTEDRNVERMSALSMRVIDCAKGFGLQWPKTIASEANLRFTYEWKPSSYLSVGKSWSAPAEVLNVQLEVFPNSKTATPTWTGTANVSTPEDLTGAEERDYYDGAYYGINKSDKPEVKIKKATLLELISKHPFSYWDKEKIDYVPPQN